MSSNGATKAAPRDKELNLQPTRYLVTQSPHFINGNIEPVGAIVSLPKGVEPGKKLVEVDAAGNPVEKKKAEKTEK